MYIACKHVYRIQGCVYENQWNAGRSLNATEGQLFITS